MAHAGQPRWLASGRVAPAAAPAELGGIRRRGCPSYGLANDDAPGLNSSNEQQWPRRSCGCSPKRQRPATVLCIQAPQSSPPHRGSPAARSSRRALPLDQPLRVLCQPTATREGRTRAGGPCRLPSVRQPSRHGWPGDTGTTSDPVSRAAHKRQTHCGGTRQACTAAAGKPSAALGDGWRPSQASLRPGPCGRAFHPAAPEPPSRRHGQSPRLGAKFPAQQNAARPRRLRPDFGRGRIRE